jgi:hypothetical protein
VTSSARATAVATAMSKAVRRHKNIGTPVSGGWLPMLAGFMVRCNPAGAAGHRTPSADGPLLAAPWSTE